MEGQSPGRSGRKYYTFEWSKGNTKADMIQSVSFNLSTIQNLSILDLVNEPQSYAEQHELEMVWQPNMNKCGTSRVVSHRRTTNTETEQMWLIVHVTVVLLFTVVFLRSITDMTE